jgi:broad specificity phosphatase PhoE
MTTAQFAADRLGLAVQPLEEINDMDFGEWQGLSIDEARRKYSSLFDLWRYRPEKLEIPGAETLEDVRKRALAAIDEVTAKHEDETIVLVSHRVVCKVLLCHILGLDNSHFWQIAQDTAAINLFEIWDGRPSVILINDTCHLRDLEA